MVVIDSSLALSWFFSGEQNACTIAVRDFVVEYGGHVPHIWALEVTNVLLQALNRKRLSLEHFDLAIEQYRLFPLYIDQKSTDMVWTATKDLARKYGLTTYDAAFLELAIRRGVPLASLDRDLRDAAKKEMIVVAGMFDDPPLVYAS